MNDVDAQLAEARALERTGRWTDAYAELDRVRASAASVETCAHARLAQVVLLRVLGRTAEAWSLLDGEPTVASASGTESWDAECLRVRAALQVSGGGKVETRELLQRAEAMFAAAGDTRGQARTIVVAAGAAAMSGALIRAEADFRRALELAEPLVDRAPQIDAANGLAGTLRYTGRLDEAEEVQRGALAMARDIDYAFGMHFALRGLAALAIARGDAASVRARCLEALEVAERIGFRDGLVWCNSGLAEAARLGGDLDEAERRYRNALREGSDGHSLIEVLANLALVAARKGDFAGARAWIDEGLRATEGPSGTGWRAILHGMMLVNCEADGDEDAWRLHYARAVALLAETGQFEADLAGSFDAAAAQAMLRGPRGVGRATRATALALEQWETLGRTAEADSDRQRLSRLADDGAPIPLGPFDLIEPIGHGAVGEVWRGVHHVLGTPVAIKVLAAALAREPSRQSSFRAEVRAVAALDHPGIVTLLDHGVVSAAAEHMSGGRLVAQSPFLVMELAEGGTLDPLCGHLPWEACERVLRDLLDGLAHAHARGVIHRDLKPANVLIASLEPLRIRITDFGLAHAVGEIAGTPATMAPEQFMRGAAHGPYTDLYALGCVATVLVSGAWPFDCVGFHELQRAHLHTGPAALRPVVAVPSGFEGWVARLLRKDPAERFSCAADALAALHTLGAPDVAPAASARGAYVGSSATLTEDDLESEEAPASPVSGGVTPCAMGLAPVPADWRDGERGSGHWWLPGAGLGLVALRSPPFVGREPERDALWNALLSVRASGRSRALALVGPAGSGRSRLLAWLCERAQETGVAERVVLSGPLQSVREAITRVPIGRASLVCLDDADDGALALARSCVTDSPERAVLVVVSSCADAPGLPTLTLSPLSDAEIATLARDRLGLDPDLADRIAERAHGRPQMVVQLVGDWLARGLLVAGEHAFALRGGAEPPIPDDLPAVWATRMATLCAGPSGLALKVAAGLGPVVVDEVWRAACVEAGEEVPGGLLERLLDARLAVTVPRGWRFAHAMAREALLAR